jgi:hypothetical protein
MARWATAVPIGTVKVLEGLTVVYELLLLEAKQVASRARRRMNALRRRFPADAAWKAPSPRPSRSDNNPDQPP